MRADSKEKTGDDSPSASQPACEQRREQSHFVQFYENDDFLIESLAEFIVAGLKADENAIVIATHSHETALAQKLEAMGIDLVGERRAGRYYTLDAAETLALFMKDGMPDEPRFDQVMGGVLDQAAQGEKRARVFGEMVALLWEQKNAEAAVLLEGMWNNLGKKHAFSLFCAYSVKTFGGRIDDPSFLNICKEHSRVFFSDKCEGPSGDPERLRVLTTLQHEAVSLRTEITRRERVEAELRRIASIVESSDDAILSKSLQGIITTWNAGAQRVFGYTAEEAIGKPVTMLMPPERQNEEPQILERIRRGDRIDHYETIRQRKDGTLIDISLTVSPVKDADGNVIGASKIARDITDRKRAEQDARDARRQLAQVNQELERRIYERTASLQEAVAQMEEFSHTVSHDLRAPLRAMQIYSEALLEDYSKQLPPEAVRYLKRIGESALLLDKMILDVLTFSRISRAELHREKVSLNKLIGNLIEQDPTLQSPRAEIHIEPLIDVMGHAPSLNQAVSNLIHNAVKFVSPGVMPRVQVWTEKRDAEVRLCIKDNGIGIDPQYQHRLFKMFERIHADLKYEGTGVGLAIVAKAVQRMGGRVGVESDGTHGSTFWLQISAAD